MGARDRLGAGPVDLVRRAWEKVVVGPLRYRSEEGYDAGRFWRDRFRRYGTSLRGAGDEGLSEERNREIYEDAAAVLFEQTRRLGVDLASARVLDIGCGPGYFTEVLARHGVASYTGLDVTDELFPDLTARFPGYRFLRRDITRDAVDGRYDCVLMIDVAEHIVHERGLTRALRTVRGALAPGGAFLIGPLMPRPKRHLFYVRFWSVDEVRARLDGVEEVGLVPFRTGRLLGVRAPA